MKRFLKTKLFDLLSCSVKECESVYYTELSNAYDDFVYQLLDFCHEEQDIILLYFTINYIELLSKNKVFLNKFYIELENYLGHELVHRGQNTGITYD